MPHSGTPSGGYSTMPSLDAAIMPTYQSMPAIDTLEAVVQYEPHTAGIELISHTPKMASQTSASSSPIYIGPTSHYGGTVTEKNYSMNEHTPVYHSSGSFLKPDRPQTIFVGDVELIQAYIEEAFEATTGKSLTELNAVIDVVPKEKFKKLFKEFGGTWSEGVQGFSINKEDKGQSIIVVKENDLDQVMITVGHEIGHVMAHRLGTKVDEEAKAFAFELAWIDALYNNNIANLKASINIHPEPAHNGVHDKAFNFVKKLILFGAQPLDIFRSLTVGEVEVE